jgi:hypothetical protein
MKLIINAPDDLVEAAMDVARVQMPGYAKRFSRSGWGWTVRRNGQDFWVCGIRGGISVRLRNTLPEKSDASSPSVARAGNLATDEQKSPNHTTSKGER